MTLSAENVQTAQANHVVVLGISRQQYITKSYTELFYDWKRRARSKAKNMTFIEINKKS